MTVTLEGRRPLPAEVQALVGPSVLEMPRRTTSGLDGSRVGMVLAVLQRRAGIKLGKQDVYAATVGGVRLTEPSVDLAVAVALASSAANLSVPHGVVAIGEVGLAGDVRRVAGLPRRIAEAERMGFRFDCHAKHGAYPHALQLEPIGAEDRQRCHDVSTAVLSYPFEGIEIERTTLRVLTFGIDTAHQYPAAHVTRDCKIVAVEQEKRSCVIYRQLAGSQGSQPSELLRQDG